MIHWKWPHYKPFSHLNVKHNWAQANVIMHKCYACALFTMKKECKQMTLKCWNLLKEHGFDRQKILRWKTLDPPTFSHKKLGKININFSLLSFLIIIEGQLEGRLDSVGAKSKSTQTHQIFKTTCMHNTRISHSKIIECMKASISKTFTEFRGLRSHLGVGWVA